MKIRAITTGASLSRAGSAPRIKSVAQFNKRAREAFQEKGFPVQTLRMTTQPWPQYCSGLSEKKIVLRIKEIEWTARQRGIDFVSIGCVHSVPGTMMIPRIIASTECVSTATVIADAKGIHTKTLNSAAHAVREISRRTKQGYGNFRFAAIACCPPDIPFFPASYHRGKTSFSLALECSDLFVEAFRGANDLNTAEKLLKRILEREFRKIEKTAKRLARTQKIHFNGIDVSPAPGITRRESLVRAFEQLGLGAFGAPGTLSIASMITRVLKSLAVKTCGYSGLMLPVLEDHGLAQACSKNMFDVDTLLAYSAVCGTGLDCIPLPGAISVKKLSAILLDVATLAIRLKKPLSARLFPAPGKKPGAMTHFKSPYLVNCKILHVK
jgi:uncharacterized protein (UPF0210 family)